jgi:enoyl-CoA hydratase
METKNLIFEKEESVAIVTINRPEKRNALNIATRKELIQVLKEIKGTNDIRVAVITGAGEKAFIAGADISELKTFGPFEMERYIETFGHGLYAMLEDLDIPVIAMVNGFCLGGGCELAMACDIRIASENAKFG